MKKYLSRFTSSDRGESYNILSWPFLLATLAYGMGFVFFTETSGLAQSSLYEAMTSFGSFIPFTWGVFALMTIVIGTSFLLFRTPPFGRISGLLGFMLWTFATACWMLTGGWLLVFAIGIPNMYFWVWQYFSLSRFRRQDALDRQTMVNYNRGQYDDELNPKDSKIEREDNRGVDTGDRFQ